MFADFDALYTATPGYTVAATIFFSLQMLAILVAGVLAIIQLVGLLKKRSYGKADSTLALTKNLCFAANLLFGLFYLFFQVLAYSQAYHALLG